MAELTLSDSQISLEQNNWFKGRVRTATSKYSNYLLNTATTDVEYEAKVNTGMRIAREADSAVQTLMFTLSGDAEVVAAGPGISDTQLQLIVEKTIKKFYPVQPTPAMYPPHYYVPAQPPPAPPKPQ